MYHYSLNGQQMGPVSEEQLRQMVAAGTLSAETLVWREGMAEWQPVAVVVPGISGGAVQCSVCKETFPVDQTVRIGGEVVCAGCKPRFVQGLREGVNDPGKNRTIYEIAVRQRKVILCFGLLLTCNIAQFAVAPVVPALSLVFGAATIAVMIFGIIAVYRLARSLGYAAILYAIAMIIPCVSLLTLLVIVSRATKVLKDAGVKVGLFGVSPANIERLRAAA